MANLYIAPFQMDTSYITPFQMANSYIAPFLMDRPYIAPFLMDRSYISPFLMANYVRLPRPNTRIPDSRYDNLTQSHMPDNLCKPRAWVLADNEREFDWDKLDLL